MKRKLTSLDVSGKKVLLRVDYNVPMQNGNIMSDARIVSSLATINYLLEQNAKIILCSHLGRPKGKVAPEFSLAPVASYLAGLLGKEVQFATDTVGEDAKAKVKALKAGQVLMLENVRFNAGEEANDAEVS